MVLTPEQWREAADFLNTCVTCGVEHRWRSTGVGGTWADELDGHALRRQGSFESRVALMKKAERIERGEED
jgi:hypothetical protein